MWSVWDGTRVQLLSKLRIVECFCECQTHGSLGKNSSVSILGQASPRVLARKGSSAGCGHPERPPDRTGEALDVRRLQFSSCCCLIRFSIYL